jgi:diaminohydroxyphosphoribosylaminopyrimidine deaminase/5-amino-6-(5-phosphoribosylamino)uracil reductase
MNDTLFIKRCLRLAKKGLGYTYPNPLVGCVIVHRGKIIAEGWHKKAGRNHAEREAILKVKDPTLLSESTLYVNLEPCDHHGKTPPCSDLIVEMKIPRVVIGCLDQNKKVLGKGLKKLQAAGCEVKIGVLESDCQKLNRRFFSFHQKKRPYVILKWAESADGFIAPPESGKPYWLTDTLSKQRVHQWRSQEQSVMVGVQTVLNDNPKLNTRLWEGNHPLPVIIDPNQRLSQSKKKLNLKMKKILTITNLNEANNQDKKTLTPEEILNQLYHKDLQSVIIEGGTNTLQHFIDAHLWDETRIFITNKLLDGGLPAPKINKETIHTSYLIKKDTLITLYKD